MFFKQLQENLGIISGIKACAIMNFVRRKREYQANQIFGRGFYGYFFVGKNEKA
jgi:hypothetical protein